MMLQAILKNQTEVKANMCIWGRKESWLDPSVEDPVLVPTLHQALDHSITTLKAWGEVVYQMCRVFWAFFLF